MSLPRYPEYKPSGVEWLGAVPEGWDVLRLKYVCTVSPSNVDKKSYENEKPVRLCNYTDVYYNDLLTADLDFMPATASEDQVTRFELKAGDIIITKDSETADDIAISAFVPADLANVVCSYHLALIRSRGKCDSRYIKRLFDSKYLKGCFAVAANGLTRVGLSQYALENVELPIPPLAEQSAIATFLDRETSKIDALVAEQERLIALLKEKRRAAISHAATKGLNPNAPMKGSGIEWLGDVPAHWDVRRLKTACELVTSGPRGWSDQISEAGSLFIQSGDLDDMLRVDFRGAKRVSIKEDAETRRTLLQDGDVLVCITGAKTGNVAVCDLVPEAAHVNQHLCLVRPSLHISAMFLGLLLSGRVGQVQFELSQHGLKQGLSLENILETVIPLPPSQEQAAIVEHVACESRALEQLCAAAERAIRLLRERRAALISAAVTGQIDVRNAA